MYFFYQANIFTLSIKNNHLRDEQKGLLKATMALCSEMIIFPSGSTEPSQQT